MLLAAQTSGRCELRGPFLECCLLRQHDRRLFRNDGRRDLLSLDQLVPDHQGNDQSYRHNRGEPNPQSDEHVPL